MGYVVATNFNIAAILGKVESRYNWLGCKTIASLQI